MGTARSEALSVRALGTVIGTSPSTGSGGTAHVARIRWAVTGVLVTILALAGALLPMRLGVRPQAVPTARSAGGAIPAGLARALHARFGPGPLGLGAAPSTAGIEPARRGWLVATPSVSAAISANGTVRRAPRRACGLARCSDTPDGGRGGAAAGLLELVGRRSVAAAPRRVAHRLPGDPRRPRTALPRRPTERPAGRRHDDRAALGRPVARGPGRPVGHRRRSRRRSPALWRAAHHRRLGPCPVLALRHRPGRSTHRRRHPPGRLPRHRRPAVVDRTHGGARRGRPRRSALGGRHHGARRGGGQQRLGLSRHLGGLVVQRRPGRHPQRRRRSDLDVRRVGCPLARRHDGDGRRRSSGDGLGVPRGLGVVLGERDHPNRPRCRARRARTSSSARPASPSRPTARRRWSATATSTPGRAPPTSSGWPPSRRRPRPRFPPPP